MITSQQPPRFLELGVLPPALRNLSPQWELKARRSARVKCFKKGEVLAEANALLDDVIFVQSGWVSLSTDGFVTEFLGPGSPYLAADLLGEHRPASQVTALTEVNVALIERKLIAQMLMENPRVLLSALDYAVLKTSRLRVTYAHRSCSPLVMRLAHLLWTLSEETTSERRRVVADISQTALASFLGCSREEVNRKLRELIKKGRVFKESRKIYLEKVLADDLQNEGYPLFFWSRR